MQDNGDGSSSPVCTCSGCTGSYRMSPRAGGTPLKQQGAQVEVRVDVC